MRGTTGGAPTARLSVVWTAGVVVTLGVGFCVGRLTASPTTPTRRTLGEVTGLIDVDGRPVHPALWHEQVVVLAIGVEATRADARAFLQSVHERHLDGSVRVVGVLVSLDPGTDRAWVEGLQSQFSVVVDGDHQLSRSVEASELPEIVILDGCRHLRHLHLGFSDATSGLVDAEIADLLSHPSPCRP